jgi:hypothetical protein
MRVEYLLTLRQPIARTKFAQQESRGGKAPWATTIWNLRPCPIGSPLRGQHAVAPLVRGTHLPPRTKSRLMKATGATTTEAAVTPYVTKTLITLVSP